MYWFRMLNFTWGTGAVSKYVYENVLSQNFEGRLSYSGDHYGEILIPDPLTDHGSLFPDYVLRGYS